jgi:tRNA threonylcarbamoyladenosine biosynthesis protein TsaB
MELSIDTASEMASIGLSSQGALVAETTWRCRRNHTVELLPAIDQLLARAGATKGDLRAVFVCSGPGMYTGLRVGISVAKGLARALELPMVGVGRLELDAYPHAAFPGEVIAVHKAGRGELAWACYAGPSAPLRTGPSTPLPPGSPFLEGLGGSGDRTGRPWREIEPPQLATSEELASRLKERCLLVGEIDESLAALLRQDGKGRAVVASPAASIRRAAALGELGFARLVAGQTDEVALLRPIYLRPPVVGPQGKPGG